LVRESIVYWSILTGASGEPIARVPEVVGDRDELQQILRDRIGDAGALGVRQRP
jgi:hypothetical protein